MSDFLAFQIMSADDVRPVPEERAIRMIEECVRRIGEARSIPDVRRIITQAEAINAVMNKIKASEKVKRAALSLAVEAERQLGRISGTLPRGEGGRRGSRGPAPKKKAELLKEQGISPTRARVAERLAKATPDAVESAMDSAKKNTVYGVTVELGIRKETDDTNRHISLEKRARALAFLAGEVFELLERVVATRQRAHAGTVAEMRSRLSRLGVEPRDESG